MIKVITNQDANYKWVPVKSGETSINLSQEIASFIAPEAKAGEKIGIKFIVHKEDYLKALGFISNILPLYESSSNASEEINYSNDFFFKNLSAINEFFAEDEEKEYSANFYNRADGRRYLNDLKNGNFNIRDFFVSYYSVLFISKSDDSIDVRLVTGSLKENVEKMSREERKEAFFEYIDKTKNRKTCSNYKTATENIQSENAGKPIQDNIIKIGLQGTLLDITDISKISLLYENVLQDPNNKKWKQTCSATVGCYRDFILSMYENPKVSYNKQQSQEWNKNENYSFDELAAVLNTLYAEGLKSGDAVANLYYFGIKYAEYIKKYKYQDIIKEAGLKDSFAQELNKSLKLYQLLKQDGLTFNNTTNGSNPDVFYQQIYYGAPGTGKSFEVRKKVKELTELEDNEENPYIFRTTFHPDYDYASFVGCYKPTMKNDDKIIYSFTPQSFTNAYIKAWQAYKQDNKPVCLVIEEINRGNCAQIFGDIFQLLDRKNGFSESPINADNDLNDYLKGLVEKNELPEDAIKNGKLQLPPNLYILATMNTSDQSLFPMDSAFKRRWNWKYTPIVDAELDYLISINNIYYKWWDFIVSMNKLISDKLELEDKKLGYFFAGNNPIIDVNCFVSKVLFYLWNDVFKDADLVGTPFKDHSFYSLFNVDGSINTDEVVNFLEDTPLDLIDVYSDDKVLLVRLDGKPIPEDNAIVTLKKVIEEIGVKRVADLGLKVKDYELLSKNKLPEDTSGGYGESLEKIEDYWMLTHFGKSRIKRLLETIKQKLSLDIEVVLKNNKN